MAFTRPGLPFKLTPQDMGSVNAPQAFAAGGSVVDQMISNKLKLMKEKTAEAELPYAGLSKLAQSASQLAYSSFLAPQFIAKLMQNPDFMANLTPDQIAALKATQVKAAGTDPFRIVQNVMSGNTNSSTPSNTNTSPSPVIPSGSTGDATNSGMSLDADGNNVRASSDEVNAVANQGNQGSATTYDPNKSYAENAANYQGTKEKGKAAGKEAGKTLSDALNTAADSSDTAQNLVNQLDRFHKVYQESTFVGKPLGMLARWGTKSSELPSIAADMQTALAAQLFGNKTSNYKEMLARDIKLNPDLPRNAEKENYQAMRAQAVRAGMMNDFYQTAAELGINDRNKIKSLWHSFNADVPMFDFKNNRPLKNRENMGAKDFSDYIVNKVKGKKVSYKETDDSSNNDDPLGWR